MAGLMPAIFLVRAVSLRAFTLRGWLGYRDRGLRRLLLRGADRVEALLQRVHQVDDPDSDAP